MFVRGGGQVRAGTALAGLCRGLQGAVRRIDDTFLLAEQVSPWLEGSERRRAAQRKIDQKFEALDAEESAADLVARKSLLSDRAADKARRGSFPDATDALWTLGGDARRFEARIGESARSAQLAARVAVRRVTTARPGAIPAARRAVQALRGTSAARAGSDRGQRRAEPGAGLPASRRTNDRGELSARHDSSRSGASDRAPRPSPGRKVE